MDVLKILFLLLLLLLIIIIITVAAGTRCAHRSVDRPLLKTNHPAGEMLFCIFLLLLPFCFCFCLASVVVIIILSVCLCLSVCLSLLLLLLLRGWLSTAQLITTMHQGSSFVELLPLF